MEKMSIKVAGVVLMCLLFWFCLLAVHGMVSERQRYARQVAEEIGRDYVGEQGVMAPFVQVPVVACVAPSTAATPAAPASGAAVDIAVAASAPLAAGCVPKQVRMAVLAPQSSDWTQSWRVRDDQFRRGLYQAKSYRGEVVVAGSLDTASLVLAPGESADWAQAQWQMAVRDRRGLTAMPVLTARGAKAAFALAQAQSGDIRWLYAPATLQANEVQQFEIRFELSGTQGVSLLPVGADTRLSMQADWPHPSFHGHSLPVQKQLENRRFNAHWHTPAAGQDNARDLESCFNQPADQPVLACGHWEGWQHMGARFVDTTDHYSLTERSVKYGMLFIVLTFATFFLYEVLQRLRIHPVQYLLVGAALTVFYLLLLSFGEQMAFGYAYLIAALACIGLIAWYLRYVLGSGRHALCCGGALGVLYGLLYWLLHTDENTLLIGSLLLFALIALVMFLTRHVDWYRPDHTG